MTEPSEKSSELVDDVIDKLHQISERFKDVISARNLRLAERYFKQEIHLLIEFGIRGIDDQFVAHLERAMPFPGDNRQFQDRFGVNAEFRIPFRSNVVASEKHPNGEQQAVLVGIVQLMEYPERMPIASLVRLNCIDRFY